MSELENHTIKAADSFVTRRGYKVLDTEWAVPEEEIKVDLVAKDEDAIVFIGVHTRANGNSLPDEAIDRKRMESNAAHWLAEHPDTGTDITVHFDAISMLVKKRGSRALKAPHQLPGQSLFLID